MISCSHVEDGQVEGATVSACDPVPVHKPIWILFLFEIRDRRGSGLQAAQFSNKFLLLIGVDATPQFDAQSVIHHPSPEIFSSRHIHCRTDVRQ
jgi:hypothetical protein